MNTPYPKPDNEAVRLQTLFDLKILDTAPEETFEEITEIAAAVCHTPMAIITLLDRSRQWFKSRVGIQVTETPRELAFCSHTILQREIMVVEDASKDDRFISNPLVTGDPKLRFYAGVPLLVSGMPVGTLAVLDTIPRQITVEQRQILKLLARHSVQQLQLRRAAFERTEILSGLLDASPLAIVSLDNDGKVVSWNKSAERVLGWLREEVLGRRYPAIPPEEEAEFQRRLVSIARGSDLQYDAQRRRKDGTVFPARIWAAAVRDPRGTVVGSVAMTEDLTRQQTLENNLRQLGAAISASEDAIITEDCDGNIHGWAGSAEEIYGYTSKEIQSKNIGLLFPAEDREQVVETLARIRSGESFTRSKVQHLRKDGKSITVSATLTPLRNTTGVIIGSCAVVRDLTAQTLVERQLAQAQKMEAVGRLAGGVAHDFNNMLGIILGYAELAEINLPDESSAMESVRMIKATALRSADLTRQLLTFSRRQVVKPMVLKVDEVIAESEKMMSRMIGEDINLEFQLNAKDGRVYGDRSQLQQVLMNLIVNARDAMPEGGSLRIETTLFIGKPSPDMQYSRYFLVRVSDSGCGMDAATRERIFEPFFTTKELGKGTGLGLSIVHGIVTQSGGHVAVHSEVGKGTRFEIYLPEAAEMSETASQEVTSNPELARECTVLLVEDEVGLREAIALGLRARGYAVREAENGEEALRAMRSFGLSIDVLVTDLIMPKMGGKQLAGELRRHNPHLKVLYISGYPDGILEESDLRDDGVDFIAKPFTTNAVDSALSRLLSGDGRKKTLSPQPRSNAS